MLKTPIYPESPPPRFGIRHSMNSKGCCVPEQRGVIQVVPSAPETLGLDLL